MTEIKTNNILEFTIMVVFYNFKKFKIYSFKRESFKKFTIDIFRNLIFYFKKDPRTQGPGMSQLLLWIKFV